MPNHVTNCIDFDCSIERCREILEFLQVKDKPLGSVDFNKLIPMPESLNIESSSRGEHGKQLYEMYLNETEKISSEAERNEIHQKILSMCKDDPQMLELGKQYYENECLYGATNWYDWSIEHWGTKWNAYDWWETSPEDGFICFNTAWSAVPVLVQVLSEKYPDVNFSYSWADEDIGYNTGTMKFKNGKVTFKDIPEGGSRHAYPTVFVAGCFY